jgi:hypothetical protein
LSELAAGSDKFGPGAEILARSFPELPYFPIGTIGELLGTIGELSGTIGDMKTNEALRKELGTIAKKGTDIRDRGALIDALRAAANYFVTNDSGLVGSAPRSRIEGRFPLMICTADELLAQLEECDTGAG